MARSVFRVLEHTLPCAHIREYHRATQDAQEQPLQIAIKQYVPVDNPSPGPGDITIIGAHANAFPKELYEPLWEDLHGRLKKAGLRIRGIWIADAAWQGYSSTLNKDLMGNDPNWTDHARDLFLMTNHFSAQMPRPIVGIGHSMGGNNIANLSLLHPRLFSTIILLDPVILRVPIESNFLPAVASVGRRDTWPSRSAAEASFRKSPFYRVWDPRVLDRWIEHGLEDLPQSSPTESADRPPPSSSTTPGPSEGAPQVTLRTTRHAEVSSFLRPLVRAPSLAPPTSPSIASTTIGATTAPSVLAPDFEPSMCSSPPLPFYRAEPGITFHKLPLLRPSTLYVFGARSELSGAVSRADKLAVTGVGPGGNGGIRAGRVAEVLVDAGHLVAMEAVGECADRIAAWLGTEMGRWEREEAVLRAVVDAIPVRDRHKLDRGVEEMLRSKKGERSKL